MQKPDLTNGDARTIAPTDYTMNKNTRITAPVALTIATLISSCASAPQAPAAPRYQAPWANATRVEFRELLASYGANNLAENRTATLDKYLRSQTKTFDRYIAAKEVGVGIAPLQQEALAEIQSASAALPTKLFLIRTRLPLNTYNAQLGGFPIYEQPADLNMSTKYFNEDIRSHSSPSGPTRGMRIAADDYGLMEAEVWFSKVGWVAPATPEQAVTLLESLSRRGGEREAAVAMTYTLDRCDASTSEPTRLVCSATIRSISAYANRDAVQPDSPPVVEFVNRGQR